MPVLPRSSSSFSLDEEDLSSSMKWLKLLSSPSSSFIFSMNGTFLSCIFLMLWSSVMVNIGVQVQKDIFMYRNLSSKLPLLSTVNASHDLVKWFFGILMVLIGVMGDCIAFSMLSLTHGVLLITGATALFQVLMTYPYQSKRIQRRNNFASCCIFLSLIELSWTFAPSNTMNETSDMMKRRSSSSRKIAGIHLLLSFITIGILYYVIQESYYAFVSIKNTEHKNHRDDSIGTNWAKWKQTFRVLCHRLFDFKIQNTNQTKSISFERSQFRAASFAIMAAIMGSFAIYFEKCIGDLLGKHDAYSATVSFWMSASLFGWMMTTAMQVHWWHRCLQEQQQDLETTTPKSIGFGWNHALRMYLTVWTLCGMAEGVIVFGDLIDYSKVFFAIGFAAFVVGLSNIEYTEPSFIVDEGPTMLFQKEDVQWIEAAQPFVPRASNEQVDRLENTMYRHVDATQALELDQNVSYRPPAYMRTL